MKSKNIVICVSIALIIALFLVGYKKRKEIAAAKHYLEMFIKSKEKADLNSLRNLDLPLIVINTFDGKEPTFLPVFAPEGSWGAGIKDANYVKTDISITLHDSLVFTSKGKIKVRGNTSAHDEKTSFKIKLEEKADLISNNTKYADKTWLLLNSKGNTKNATNLKNAIGLEINKLMELNYTPRYEFVNLVINGNYRGVYMLTEAVNRDKYRVNISKSGYIVEYDAYWWLEDKYFKTEKTHDAVAWTFKYPKEIGDNDIEYMRGIVERFEKSLEEGIYEHYIDISSWASWLLVHDILGNSDAGGSNIFICKNDATNNSFLVMPTTWDYDGAMYMTDDWSMIHKFDGYFYFPSLLNNVNNAFLQEYIRQYTEKSADVFDGIDIFLRQLETSSKGKSLSISLKKDARRWGLSGGGKMENEITSSRQWLLHRKKWMDEKIDSLKSVINENANS